jgi:hypothetical protein
MQVRFEVVKKSSVALFHGDGGIYIIAWITSVAWASTAGLA